MSNEYITHGFILLWLYTVPAAAIQIRLTQFIFFFENFFKILKNI